MADAVATIGCAPCADRADVGTCTCRSHRAHRASTRTRDQRPLTDAWSPICTIKRIEPLLREGDAWRVIWTCSLNPDIDDVSSFGLSRPRFSCAHLAAPVWRTASGFTRISLRNAAADTRMIWFLRREPAPVRNPPRPWAACGLFLCDSRCRSSQIHVCSPRYVFSARSCPVSPDP
jgi:hypothetical protein